MSIDAALAFLHHLAAFALFGFLAAEWILLTQAPSRALVGRLALLDAGYGLAAVASLAMGVSRLVWGLKPAAVYLDNPVFWAKMACWLLIGLISIVPTVRFIQWRRKAYLPSEADFARLRRLLAAQVALFPAIPVLAALMARGVGL
jgi:putative membrane protein